MRIGVMIPIKEHSQRVPGKSFRILKNKPLAHWIVDTLVSIKPEYDMTIWYNTDSTKVGELFEDYPEIEGYLRPPSVQGPDVSMNKVIAEWKQHHKYDMYIQTHITNPFLDADTIRRGIRMFESSGGSYSIIGVTRHQCRAWYKGIPVNFDHGSVIPTQDLTPVYEDNSCLYIFNDWMFDHWGRVSFPPLMLEVPWPENIDIDTEEEWKLAQVIANEFVR